MYCSSTLALAALEYLVHVDPDDAPSDLLALELVIPANAAVDTQSLDTLPVEWRDVSVSAACHAIGDAWVARGKSIGLFVPSVIIPVELNLLLNPAHDAMASVRVVSTAPFAFDPRLRYRA